MLRYRMSRTLWNLLAGCGLAALMATAPHALGAEKPQWPHWRGPEQNGISREVNLPTEWSPKGENLLWKSEEYAGRSTPIYMNGRLFTITRCEPGTSREREMVVAIDPNTGKELWRNDFNIFLSDVPDTRVGWSSVVGDPKTDRVYALGVCGLFQCIDGATGKTIWEHSLSEEYGLLSTYGGRTNFPVLYDDLVIISAVVIGWGDMAKPAHRFIAFDNTTGEPVWYSSTRPLPEDTTYSTPIVTTINGEPMMIFGAGDGSVYGMQPATGKIVWEFKLSRRGINTTPLVVGNTVFAGQAEENIDDNTMGNITAIDATGKGDVTKSKELWRLKEILVGRSQPIEVDGKLYVVDDRGTLLVLDAKTGEQLEKKKIGTAMRGSPVYADGKIYVVESTGRWWVFEPTEKGLKVVAKQHLKQEVNASPVIADGKIFLTTQDALYAIGTKESASGNYVAEMTPAPEPAKQKPADMTPAQVQVIPVEALVRPDQKIDYKIRLFNEAGQFVREEKGAKFTIDGPGSVDANGVYVAGEGSDHTAATITATVGDLKGTARVRIVPGLPWNFDFSKAVDVPITWIGARYRHVIREEDGKKVMVKVTTIPKGTRSQSWMGHPYLSDYTVQADVKGFDPNGKLPDIGLIAQRYTLDMMGESQQLQIRTWPPMLRMAKTVPFKWTPKTWYTMKFKATVEDGKAVLRGKVWPRGETEPEGWIIEAYDESPNLKGSPGLYGNATNGEIFIDNVKVTPNDGAHAAGN